VIEVGDGKTLERRDPLAQGIKDKVGAESYNLQT